MGQARQRGTFQQRQAEGKSKRKEQQELNERNRLDFEKSLSPRQRHDRNSSSLLLAGLYGMFY